MEIALSGRVVDRTGLYWGPLGKRQAGVLLSAVTLHFRWMRNEPAAAGWVQAASTDAIAKSPRVALNLALELMIRKHNSLLGHLKGMEREPSHAFPGVVERSRSATGAVPTFPAKYVAPFLYNGFTDKLGECDEAAQLLAHLIIALGIRKSEGLHLYTSDVQFVGDIPWIIPLRMGQIRRLDGGEGDVRHFNGDRTEWQENNGPLAGYWADLAGESRKNFPTRGCAIEIEDEIKTITGVWANTNKTGKPFAIPWYIPNLLKNLWDLRKWQEKFNPITTPLGPENYLDAPRRYPEATKAEMPHIFPLSRLLPTSYRPTQGRIVTGSELDHAWCSLLLEIQLRWNKQHPGNQVTLVDIHPKSKQPYHPRYNIHGLRVHGLTNLRRGGMPLDLLSKFVAGHATLAMLIYYTEPHPSEVADQIEKAAARFEAQREFIDDLKRMEVDEALKRTVSVSQSAVPTAIESGSQFQFCNVAVGVCPYDGSRCSDGGALLRREEIRGVSKSVYGPVEPRNCVMCRHFISGPPWLNELVGYGIKLCERRQYLAREEDRINETARQYEQAHRDGTIGNAEFENRWEDLGTDMQQVKNEQEMVENALFNVELLCNASVKLLDGDPKDEAGVMLVANSRSSVVEYREVSEFEQAVRITAAGRIHRILGDERVERKRDEYLNLMLFNSSVTSPQMITSVSREHRQRAMDQYALFMSSRVSNEEIEGLVEGTLRLRDLEIEEQVRSLIDVALPEPILLPGMARRHEPAALGITE